MEKIIVYTVGSALGNPGPAAVGIYITDDTNKLIKEVKQSLGNGTEDFAGYYGVMLAMQVLVEIYGDKTRSIQFEFRISSELVKQQLNDEVKINHPGLVPMFIEIHNMKVEHFPNIALKFVPREKNIKATLLANEALAGK